MNGKLTVWLAPAGLLVAAGITSFCAQLFIFPPDAKPSDWRTPAGYVVDHIGPNDAINVQPNWTEAPYPYLTEVGDQVIRQNTPLLEDVYQFDHLWLLAETDEFEEAVEHMPLAPATHKSFGPVTVARIDVPDPSEISAELFNMLPRAEVSHLKDGEVVERCRNWKPKQRAWHCGSPDPWVYVGEERVDVGGDPHRCIWAHPPADQKRLRVVFPDVELGAAFRVRGGLNNRGARSVRGTDVHYRISIGESWTHQRRVDARETSWAPVDLDTSTLAGKTRDVTLQVWSESVFDRLFCVNGWVLETPASE